MMTPDLAGRWQTRLALFVAAVLPTMTLLHVVAGYGVSLTVVLLFGCYWLIAGLLLDIVGSVAQRLRREGDWPLAFTLYALAMELLAVYGLMVADVLPLLQACAVELPDLALRRMVCGVPTVAPLATVGVYLIVALEAIVLLTIALPVLAPGWRFRRWRLVPGRRRTPR